MDGDSGRGGVNQESSRVNRARVQIPWTCVDEIRRLANEGSGLEALSSSRAACGANDVVLYGHSSGTSTGLPKPIPITSRDEIGALPRFHEMNIESRLPSTFTTTPIYTGGLADLWRSWSAAATLWTFPEDQVPVTGQNIMRFLDAAERWQQRDENIDRSAPVGYVSCVPFVVQMMAEDKILMEILRFMEMVGVGGAAMPAELGDSLVREGVNLISRYGSRECGFLLASNRDFDEDKEWQYLRKHPEVESFIFQNWNDTDYELIVTKTWPSLSPAIRPKLPYNSHDVFQPHPTIANAWKYCGRSDVQITLVTGKKFDPAGIESTLCTSQLIHDAVIVGDNMQCPAALIFLTTSAESLPKSEQAAKIWEAVTNVNESCPSHARLERDMIKLLPSSEASKIQKSSKGTVMRGRFAADFEMEIKQLYEGSAAAADEIQQRRPLESEDLETRISIITSIIRSQVKGDPPDLESNFYDKGVDSMTCMQIRNRIKSKLSAPAAQRLPLNVVYEAGSTRRLAEVVGNLGTGSAPDSGKVDRYIETRMRALVDQYASLQAELLDYLSIALEPLTKANREVKGRCVLLTGATGFLGVHILSQLLNMPQISQIILPVRVSSENGLESSMLAQRRVDATLESYHLSLPSRKGPSVRYFAADLDSRMLGLDNQDFQDLVFDVTDVIHAAWAVNFNIPLEYFETQLKGLINLYNVAALAQANHPSRDALRPVSFVFCSSTASVISSRASPITELNYEEPSLASNTGYGRSKWVAEHVLSHLTRLSSSKPQTKILRIGQLCGSTTSGAWNRREAWPLMFDAGLRCMNRQLPDLHAAGLDRLDWLPVDLAARSVLEIALQQDQDQALDPRQGAPVYHVANSDDNGVKWRDIQQWLARSSSDKEGAILDKPVKIVPAQEWLDSLESLTQDHQAKNLIELWRKGWGQSDDVQGRSNLQGIERGHLSFDTIKADRLSATMRDKGQIAMSEEIFRRMLNWMNQNSQEAMRCESLSL